VSSSNVASVVTAASIFRSESRRSCELKMCCFTARGETGAGTSNYSRKECPAEFAANSNGTRMSDESAISDGEHLPPSPLRLVSSP
jgi:hypothetical protein